MASPGWPALLADGRVGLRPLRLRDATAWTEVRVRNEQWLAPWEGAPAALGRHDWAERHSASSYAAMLRALRREARAGRTLPFALTYDGALAGQVTVSSIVRGAFDSGSVGYWVDRRFAGRGVVSTALALAVDHCFGPVGLHRVEANARPENAPSLRVLDKVGFRSEGRHLNYLFIDGAWRDHLAFALTQEDHPAGVLRRLRAHGDTPPEVHR